MLSYKEFNLSKLLVSDWLDIVGNFHPFGQIEFLGLLVVLLYVLAVSEEELLEAIAVVQL